MAHIIPQNYLFRLRFPVHELPSELFSEPLVPEALNRNYRIAFWSQYDLPDGFDKRTGEPGLLKARTPEIEDRFDFRFGWSNEGLAFTVVLGQKKTQGYWTHTSLHQADCVRLCIDTRDVKENKRANKFCHKFIFYPFIGESADTAKPLTQWLPINRARATPNAVDVSEFRTAAELRPNGYVFSGLVPAKSLTGYDPDDFNRLGMHYVVRDSLHGAFVLQYADPAPCEEDPSLWASFVLQE